MNEAQVALYVNNIGIISMLLLQCRPFLVKYLSEHFSIINDAFSIREIYKKEISSLLMLFLTFLEFLSLLQVYIEINVYPILISLLTGGFTTIFMISEISYDVIINCYTYGLTPKQRNIELLCKSIRKNQNLFNIPKKKIIINSNSFNINDLQLEDWGKLKKNTIFKDQNSKKGIFNCLKKSHKWKK